MVMAVPTYLPPFLQSPIATMTLKNFLGTLDLTVLAQHVSDCASNKFWFASFLLKALKEEISPNLDLCLQLVQIVQTCPFCKKSDRPLLLCTLFFNPYLALSLQHRASPEHFLSTQSYSFWFWNSWSNSRKWILFQKSSNTFETLNRSTIWKLEKLFESGNKLVWLWNISR